MGYAYNGNDALSVLTYGSGKTVSCGPDAFGRPRQALPYVTAVGYHPSGQPSSFTYANGVQTTIGLNPRLWPASLKIGKTSNLFDMSYGYDAVGNVMSISDTVDAEYNRTMGYDGLDRLTHASGPWGSGTIGYDKRGNILHQTFGAFSISYAYDSATERLAGISGSRSYAFNYDVYGNVTGNGSKTFAYDDAQNMRCAQCGLPDETQFDHDGRNQRVRLHKGTQDTYFVHNHGGQLLWEETPGANLKCQRRSKSEPLIAGLRDRILSHCLAWFPQESCFLLLP